MTLLTIKQLSTFLLLGCLVGCQQTPQRTTSTIPKPELQRLTAALDDAQTQTGMNMASRKTAEFWDAKLASIEKRISQKLDTAAQQRFADSKKRWYAYRNSEVQFRSSFFAGGSIQPLITNQSYSEITEHRVAELETLWADTLETQK